MSKEEKKNKGTDKAKGEEKLSKKQELKSLREKLTTQQQEIRTQGLPVIVLVEGWATSGKGSLINQIISELDPRFYNVTTHRIDPESQSRYPFLYPYAQCIPGNGKIMIYDSGWMEDCVRKLMRREITKEEYKKRVRSVNEFERQLRDGGYLILKLFLDIDKDEQKKRIREIRGNYETEWRVSDEDMWQHREYKSFRETYEAFMEKTGKVIPWNVLDGGKRRDAAYEALKLLTDMIDKALEKGRYVGKPFDEEFPLIKMPKLADVNLMLGLSDEEYREQLKKLQKRLGKLHNVIYRKKIPVVLCYEGWEAIYAV